jgi:hypothetical protein
MEDAKIAMLFGQWTAAERFADDEGRGDDNEFMGEADETARLLAAEPAAGLLGVLLKVFLLAYEIRTPNQ